MPLDKGDVLGQSFQIEIDGVALAQFKEVSGIASEVTVIEHRENTKGGIPVVKKLPGLVKHPELVCKHGLNADRAFWDWHKKVKDGDIKAARKNGSIVVYDYAHGEVSRWNFVAGWPSKVNVSPMQAQGSDVLVEECTIVHEGLSPA